VKLLFAPRDLRRSYAADVEQVDLGLWVPGAERITHPKSNGLPYVAMAPWRFVFHTVEAQPSAEGFRAMALHHGNPPHLWAMPSADLLLQLIPLERAAYALAHPTGTPHTNRMKAVQVECWGYARDMANASADVLNWLADRVLGPVARLVPINLDNVRATRGEECYGRRSACRMTDAEWQSFDGVCGHQHVPNNAHWDPGRLDLGYIAARAALARGTVPQQVRTRQSEAFASGEFELEDDSEIHGDSTEAAEASGRSSAARLQWVNLTQTPGGDGRNHLYYLTSGPPGGGPSNFRLRVTNTNSINNLKNPSLNVRLRARTGPDQSTVIPLDGQGDKPWKTIRSSEVEDESSRTIELYLDGATRWRAYDPDQPLRWLDVEYHWYEGAFGAYSGHDARTSLAFFLVAPAELMLRQKRLVEERALDDQTEHATYWRLLWENSEPSPVQFSLNMQSSVSDARTGQVSVTSGTTVTRGTERSEQVTATSELSVGFGIDKMFSLGQKLGTSISSGIRWSDSVARTFTTVASRTRTFTEGHAVEFQISGTIPAAPPGRRQSLFAYPVVGVYEVPVVLFGAANELGQATRRQTDKVPIVWLRGWGSRVVLT
jgi:hypothetical protein